MRFVVHWWCAASSRSSMSAWLRSISAPSPASPWGNWSISSTGWKSRAAPAGSPDGLLRVTLRSIPGTECPSLMNHRYQGGFAQRPVVATVNRCGPVVESCGSTDPPPSRSDHAHPPLARLAGTYLRSAIRVWCSSLMRNRSSGQVRATTSSEPGR